jgi:pimeloyl-ACP methyl ester carboxylesterase
MSPEPLHVVRVGKGPRWLLVHGSAADHSTWAIQLASPLRHRFALEAVDRRAVTTVEESADDLAALIGDDRVLLAGSSFGAVVVLDVLRRYPARCAGAVLIEPPMAASDAGATAPASFLAELDDIAVTAGPEAAAEKFLRTVLGDAVFERMPRAFQDRSKAKWPQIRADSAALIAYRPRYAELGSVGTPVLLVGGDRSAPYFRPTLDALAAALPAARLAIIPAAGHMLHAEAPRKFTELVTAFADSIELS